MEPEIQVIIGLGNPGDKYTFTRHNIGRQLVSTWLRSQSANISSKFKADYSILPFNGRNIHYAMPNTYMNASGESVSTLLNYYKLSAANILVIQDDLDLKEGVIRLRYAGSSGGHNGINSIIANLKTQDFWRLKIGIGKPLNSKTIEHYVLQDFSNDSKPVIESTVVKILQQFNRLLEGKFTEIQKKLHTNS